MPITSPQKPRSLRSRVRALADADVNVRKSETEKEKRKEELKSNSNVQNRWDDWVPQDRVMKFTEDNKELAAQLHQEMKKMVQKPKSATTTVGKKLGGNRNGSEFGSGRGSEERHASVAAQGGRGGPRRNRDYDLEQEENFHIRPSINIVIPDHIKAILVDDWENVTKSQQLVPLPHKKSVNQILNDWLEFEKPKRPVGSAQADILEEIVAGLKEYFERCLGRILLYRFERQQYTDFRQMWDDEASEQKCASDTYGAEHLCRLLVTLPELVAQTNMDLQSVNRLREELGKLTNWIGKNAKDYFVNEYETPGAEYVDKARSNN